jgi:hypothetical protein
MIIDRDHNWAVRLSPQDNPLDALSGFSLVGTINI